MSTLEDFDRILAELAPSSLNPAASAAPASAPAPAASAPKAAAAPPPGPGANKTVAPPRPSVVYDAAPAVATPPRQASNPGLTPSNADKIAELESMLLDLGPSPKASPVVSRSGPSANVSSPGTPKASNNTAPPAGGAAKNPLSPPSGPRRNASISVSKPAPTVTSGDVVVCGRCEKQITGTYISALDKNWHPEHFTCHSCNKSLNGNFFDTDKGILCTDCASEQIKCAECGKPITGTHLIYGDGRPVHNECVPKSKCGRCSNFLSLGDAHVEALDQLWHPECFACTRCMTPLGATFVQFEGTPYCQACIQILSKERNIVFKT